MPSRPRHSSSIKAVPEAPEDHNAELRGKNSGMASENKKRREHPSHSSAMGTTRPAGQKPKDKTKTSHRSSFSSSRHPAKNVLNNAPSKRSLASRAESHPRHRQSEQYSDSSSSSSSSSSSDEEEVDSHQAVLAAARARLTSPSVISNMTSLTTATNNSGGSSGSNSAVTQASMSRVAKEAPISGTMSDDDTMSPAVPDPPNVFAFLEEESDSEDEDKEDEDKEAEYEEPPAVKLIGEHEDHEDHDDDDDDEETEEYDDDDEDEDDEETKEYDDDDNEDEAADVVYNDIHPQPAWLSHPPSDDATTPLARQLMTSSTHSISSTSSLHSDTSDQALDNDTDRSTSPECSVKGASPPPTHATPAASPPAADPATAKLAAQMHAAQHRQGLHPTRHAHRSRHPPPATQALSPRPPSHLRPPSLPITGYEALAHTLSLPASPSTLPPLYRRFSALNHRLLLHMQDELCELEAQLHALDAADTAARIHPSGAGDDVLRVRPASRRASAAAGGEMEWCRIELLNRVSIKLGQYNAALAAFRGTAGLPAAEAADVSAYRAYLRDRRPVVESEVGFLESGGDLVTLAPPHPPPAASPPPAAKPAAQPPQAQLAESDTDKATAEALAEAHQQALLLAVAAALLVPVAMFAVVPTLAGRMAVALLVAAGLLGSLAQRGVRVELGARGRAVALVAWAVGMGGVAGVVA